MNRLVPLVSAAFLAGAASAADVTIVNPRLKWLFGGFGFQNAESRLTALMGDEFRDERAIKCFRELAPSYSRVYVGVAGESKESLDRFADYYERTFKACDTSIYAVGGVMPAFADWFVITMAIVFSPATICSQHLEPLFS